MSTRRLTETLARSIEVVARTYFWDAQISGFGLRVAPPKQGRGGPPRRVWVYRYRAADTKRRHEVKLGNYPVMDFPAARERAMTLALSAAQGQGPKRERPERTSAMTMRSLCERYEAVRFGRLSPKTARTYRSMLANHILHPTYGIGELAVDSVSKDDLQALVDTISTQHNRVGTRKVGQGKKVRSFLGTLMNFAIEEGLRPADSSPLRGVRVDTRRQDWELEKIQHVGHVFEPAEVSRVWEALDTASIHSSAADALRLIALTGVRCDEVRLLIWRDVVLDGTYPHIAIRRHKTDARRPIKDVPLSASAIEILERRTRGRPEAYVFTSPVDPKKPIGDLWSPWQRVRDLAGVPRARLHDLRGLAACQLVAAGWSETQIQTLLGWDSPAMVRIYAGASRELKLEGARVLEHGLREA